MVALTRIYTRTGDAGQTALGDGSRVSKHSVRVAAYGTVDEANAALGIAALHATDELRPMLARIQNELFDLGADLCRPGGQADDGRHLRIVESQVERLEREIDAMNARLSPLRSFVLPGGTSASAYLHLARTIVRRAERYAVELALEEAVSGTALRYLNRLSDHLFVASRAANQDGALDVLWAPGATR
jgi:cob(I)alamin adenosyltransferase